MILYTNIILIYFLHKIPYLPKYNNNQTSQILCTEIGEPHER